MTDTATIREAVTELAFSPKTIWPNGLGFSWRGWEYTCRGRDHWTATRDDHLSGKVLLGRGETPTDAKANAYSWAE